MKKELNIRIVKSIWEREREREGGGGEKEKKNCERKRARLLELPECWEGAFVVGSEDGNGPLHTNLDKSSVSNNQTEIYVMATLNILSVTGLNMSKKQFDDRIFNHFFLYLYQS